MTPDEIDDFIRSEEWRDRLQTDFDVQTEVRRQQWLVAACFALICGMLAAIAWVGGA